MLTSLEIDVRIKNLQEVILYVIGDRLEELWVIFANALFFNLTEYQGYVFNP